MEAYERLLGDAMDGDPLLFARQDAVEAAWDVVGRILDDAIPVHPYARGSWGPVQAQRLTGAGGAWRDPAAR
jgi:glucose-6-phosphate 1-dehydrogenase